MDRSVKDALDACIAAVMSDEPWQNCGLEKRPRHSVWAGDARPKWRVELDKELLKEMLGALTAAYIVSRKMPGTFADMAAVAYSTNSEISPLLGIASPREHAKVIKRSITEYVAAPPDQWAQILFTRVKSVELPDKKLHARLSLGCTQFGTTTKNMVTVLAAKAG